MGSFGPSRRPEDVGCFGIMQVAWVRWAVINPAAFPEGEDVAIKHTAGEHLGNKMSLVDH